MPPKQATSSAPRGRPPGSKSKAATTSRPSAGAQKPSAKAKGKQRAQPSESPDPRRRGEAVEVDDDDDDDGDERAVDEVDVDDDDDDEEPEKTIPPELLTRVLHEFFEKDSTRITKDANNTVAKYMDVFVKEAIARAAAERQGGFLEVCHFSIRGRPLYRGLLVKGE